MPQVLKDPKDVRARGRFLGNVITMYSGILEVGPPPILTVRCLLLSCLTGACMPDCPDERVSARRCGREILGRGVCTSSCILKAPMCMVRGKVVGFSGLNWLWTLPAAIVGNSCLWLHGRLHRSGRHDCRSLDVAHVRVRACVHVCLSVPGQVQVSVPLCVCVCFLARARATGTGSTPIQHQDLRRCYFSGTEDPGGVA